ncbi:aminoglycoside phosphotransferase family protein [Streptomyces sp. NPDC056361]|uniref:aminoglycoside phosphotransferase family protein n=1 Tax=Streptomyces sp. NPDC056361 TaxID=3345795 RepID=UPI0035D8B0EC
MDVRIEIDEGLIRGLLREQHPDLAELPIREVPGGWDNQLWRVGDELAVRMPRTERAPDLLRKEYRWLPVLAPPLPLPVPVPVRTGEPSERFPRFWTVARWVAGEPADAAPVTRGEHAAEALAGFLRVLHRAAPEDAPVNPHRGVPLSAHAGEAERGLRLLSEFADAAAVRRVWEDALAAPEARGTPVWLHGDLHPANVVVTDGTLSGVLDFGELCSGDPATDLSAAWLLLPAGAASRFFEAYGDGDGAGDRARDDGTVDGAVGVDLDEATVRRARGWALLRAAGLIDIGRAGDQGLPGGKPTWGPAGRAALARVLADG